MKTFRPLAALAAAVLLLSLAACSSAPGASHEVSTSNDVRLTPHSLAEDSVGADARSVAGERSIVRTGNITLEVASTADAVDTISDVAKKLGGSVVSQTVSRGGGSSLSGDMTIRVPSEKLEAAFKELSQLGTVLSENRGADDVTEQHVDLQARVKSLTASVERLRELMAEARSTSDLLEAERALSERQQELDGLSAQLTSLEGQVEEANIWVSVREASALPGGGPQNFWDAVMLGISSFGTFAVGTVIALGVALPWLVVVGIIAAAIVIPIRRRKRRAQSRSARQRQAVPALPPESQPEGSDSVAETPRS